MCRQSPRNLNPLQVQLYTFSSKVTTYVSPFDPCIVQVFSAVGSGAEKPNVSGISRNWRFQHEHLIENWFEIMNNVPHFRILEMQ